MNESSTLHRIVYVSTAVNQFSETDIENILAISRKHNAANSITGILLYNDGNILQVLEGDKKEIHTLYGNITQDKRHYGCLILQDTSTMCRSFSEWSMAFKSISQIEFLQVGSCWDMKNKHLPLLNSNTESTLKGILDQYLETMVKHH